LILKNYWALIIGILLREVANAVILTVRSKWKPTSTYSFEKLKNMLSFSLWSMFEQLPFGLRQS